MTSQKNSKLSAEVPLPQERLNLRDLRNIIQRDPVLWLIVIAFSLVVFIFYNTEFRDVLEDWFFDHRVKWSPQSHVDDVVVVAIDDDSMEVLDQTKPRIDYDGKNRPYLSIESVTKLASVLAGSEAAAVAFLLPNHLFPHNDKSLSEFIDIVRLDPRFLVGTTEYNRTVPGVAQIPMPLKSIEQKVYGYETFRKRSNVIVRNLPFTSYRGIHESLMLPVQLSAIVSGQYSNFEGSYTLNPKRPSAFKAFNANLAILDPEGLRREVAGKTVIVGYTVLREIPYQTTDVMFVNTPLVGDPQNVEHGMPLTYLTANAVDSLLHNTYLRPSSPLLNFLQTIIVAVICGLLWELGSVVACLLTVVIWLGLIIIHAMMFRYMSLIIPLADTFLVSALVSLFAAVRRLNIELQSIALQEANTESKEEIARVQSLFLSDFAGWLMNLNAVIVAKIRASQLFMSDPLKHTAVNTELFQKAYAAGEEFSEYLNSIRQLPSLENISKRLEREEIDLQSFLERIQRRFDMKIYQKNLTVSLDIAKDARAVMANANLLDSIIFNFLSNAMKYAPPASTIIVSAARADHGKTVISVSDEGPGIPVEQRDKIFEKFYRIQDDSHYQGKGTGLGLYLCRFFATRMRGRVDVVANQPQGSQFRVFLP